MIRIFDFLFGRKKQAARETARHAAVVLSGEDLEQASAAGKTGMTNETAIPSQDSATPSLAGEEESAEDELAGQNDCEQGMDEAAETTDFGASEESAPSPDVPETAVLVEGYEVVDGKIIRRSDYAQIADTDIEALNLGKRAGNCLRRHDIVKISQLVEMRPDDLLKIRHLGTGTAHEIVVKLGAYLNADNLEPPVPAEPVEEFDSPVCLSGVLEPLDPAVPVLAEGYAVVDGTIIRRSDCAPIVDAEIEMLNLSVRAGNCLWRCNITQISQLVGMSYAGFRRTRNLGALTANEIIEKLDSYLSCHVLENGVSTAELIVRKPLPINKVLSYFSEYAPFGGIGEEDIPRLFADEEKDDVVAALDALVAKKSVIFEDGLYRRKYPSFFDAFEKFLETANESDRRAGEVVQMRVEGKTLEEIGKVLGITRERVRQMESQAFNKVIKRYGDHFEDDGFAYLVKNYAVEDELLDILTGHNRQTVYYLEKRYKRGDKAIETAPDDKQLSVELRRRIEKWLDRDYFFVDGERIHRDRRSIEDVVLRKYCADGCSFDEFCERYNQFLLFCDLPPEKMQALLMTGSVKRARINRLSESRKLLWGQNQCLRYYDIDAIDATELFETLDLGRFENIEISTRKFVRDYPDLMEKYDIRDEYELHNLLRKLGAEKENPSLRFAKMPSIVFGEFDREQAVKELLFELAPISAEDLAEKISEEYGHRTDNILSNWLSCVWDYSHQGMFSVDYREMPAAHMALLKENLKDNFCFFGDIKKIYRELIPDADVSLISPFNLKRMGFTVNRTYAFRNFDSAEAYFKNLLTCREIVDASGFHDRFKNIQSYGQVLKELKRDYTIIEFEPMQYINISRLQKTGITAEQLRAFCDAVYAFVDRDTYFTVESLNRWGFTTELDSLGFGTRFYISLLREDARFANWRVGHNTLFYTWDTNVKHSNRGSGGVSIKAFVSAYMKKVKSIDIDGLLSAVADEYNIKLDRWKVIEECKDAGLYYDRIMEKLYIDYDTYFEEI